MVVACRERRLLSTAPHSVPIHASGIRLPVRPMLGPVNLAAILCDPLSSLIRITATLPITGRARDICILLSAPAFYFHRLSKFSYLHHATTRHIRELATPAPASHRDASRTLRLFIHGRVCTRAAAFRRGTHATLQRFTTLHRPNATRTGSHMLDRGGLPDVGACRELTGVRYINVNDWPGCCTTCHEN